MNRPLLALLTDADARRRGLLRQPVPLSDADFTVGSGRLLFSWVQYGPELPTWSTLGLIDTEDAGLKGLFFRQLSPARVRGALLAVLPAEDAASPTAVGGLLRDLMAADAGLIGDAAPDVVQITWDAPGFFGAVGMALSASRRLRELGLAGVVEELRRFDEGSRPVGLVWDEVFAQWYELVEREGRVVGKLSWFPLAWRWRAELLPEARAFGELDDFLARFGEPVFRRIAREEAEMALRMREREVGPEHPELAADYVSLAMRLLDLGQLVPARERIERAIEIAERQASPDESILVVCYCTLASILHARGELRAGRRRLERAIAILQRRMGADHPVLGTSYFQLAAILHDLQEHAAAGEYRRRAEALRPGVGSAEGEFRILGS